MTGLIPIAYREASLTAYTQARRHSLPLHTSAATNGHHTLPQTSPVGPPELPNQPFPPKSSARSLPIAVRHPSNLAIPPRSPSAHAYPSTVSNDLVAGGRLEGCDGGQTIAATSSQMWQSSW
ncbi:hypothetical protein V2G26_005364 [Clonostachys chloroleuca]